MAKNTSKTKQTDDDAILELRQAIAEKQAALKQSEKFQPVTNCSLYIDDQHINLHVLNERANIIHLLVKLNAHRMSAENLGLESEYKIGAYSINDWLTDLKARLAIVDRKKEQGRLQALQVELDTLLSADRKRSLRVEEIKKQI